MPVSKLSFGATIEEWVRKIKGAEEAVFHEAVEELVARLNRTCPVDTGFLRASLVASNTEMPNLTRTNPGGQTFPVDAGQIEAVINSTDIGVPIFLGYSAKYGAYLHFGAQGRPPRPWVQLVAQQWQEIVSAKVGEVKRRLDL